MPQLAIDASMRRRRPAAEPLAACAFRLAETLALMRDAAWCAAVGPHRAQRAARARRAGAGAAHARRPRGDRGAARRRRARAGAARSSRSTPARCWRRRPTRAASSAACPPRCCARRRRWSPPSWRARRRVRPRPGFGVVVVEYDSACRLEDLVAERWRGLRPGTVVLVANHGAVEGAVAVTAKAAVREAVDGCLEPPALRARRRRHDAARSRDLGDAVPRASACRRRRSSASATAAWS